MYVSFVSFSEFRHYIRIRCEYLVSSMNDSWVLASVSTVLVTAIPEEFRNESALKNLYQDFPGGVRKIWLNQDVKSLADNIEKYRRGALLLEDAETNLIQKAVKGGMSRPEAYWAFGWCREPR
jgi:calcium permeable stress-gated cation channel